MNITPNTCFVLVNDGAGEDVTDEVLTEIAAAIDHALSHSFRDAWGGLWSCRARPVSATDIPLGPNDVPVSLQADSNVPGAGGYHTDDAIFCFRDGLPSLTSGDFAVSVVISHEIFETCVDPGANQWADGGSGTEYAKEACDAVEGFSFVAAGTSVSLSDFLLPSFFDPSGQRPYSFLDKPSAPFETAPDSGADYQIVRTVNESGAKQVTAVGRVHVDRLRAKKNAKSRSSRRGMWAISVDARCQPRSANVSTVSTVPVSPSVPLHNIPNPPDPSTLWGALKKP